MVRVTKGLVMRYDLLVVGSGPSGQKGAIAAAKLGKRVALVERRSEDLGGVCLHTGTIPSKTMREAILYLSGYKHREVYKDRYVQKRKITMDDLRRKLDQVIAHETQVIQEYLDRNQVDLFSGEAQFVDAHTVQVTREKQTVRVAADKILVACGTKPSRPSYIPFDGRTIFDSDELLQLEQIPRSMIVIGAGVIGIEYAIMFATLGVEVTVVDGRERLLDFCDREIVDALMFHARSLGMVFRLGEDVVGIDRLRKGLAAVRLESGKRLIAETALFAAGRVGDTAALDLQAAGLTSDERGRLWCDENHRTWVPHIYGVGDVIGFPALASASMEQGRRAVCAMFDRPYVAYRNLPYGLYTIPEISMIGKTEQQLTTERVPYEVGVANFREIARGQISGDENGLLKLLFHRETKELLGVHCIGDTATEIIHIGQAVMALGGTIEYFRDTVFNYPTMAEAYKVAAFNGLNKLDLELLPRTDDELDLLSSIDELTELCAGGTM
ncbi:MAG TPA: Si-specific NAD(P)(+) transhydrogenase [Planctomycetaceae bacterium]|nr:Si-specific NAD(P)(+) transhydrogenase [Planctomycetaceae bacterium]